MSGELQRTIGKQYVCVKCLGIETQDVGVCLSYVHELERRSSRPDPNDGGRLPRGLILFGVYATQDLDFPLPSDDPYTESCFHH